MTLMTGLRHAERLARAWSHRRATCRSPAAVEAERHASQPRRADLHWPTARIDPVIADRPGASVARRALVAAAIAVEWHEYPMPHSVCAEGDRRPAGGGCCVACSPEAARRAASPVAAASSTTWPYAAGGRRSGASVLVGALVERHAPSAGSASMSLDPGRPRRCVPQQPRLAHALFAARHLLPQRDAGARVVAGAGAQARGRSGPASDSSSRPKRQRQAAGRPCRQGAGRRCPGRGAPSRCSIAPRVAAVLPMLLAACSRSACAISWPMIIAHLVVGQLELRRECRRRRRSCRPACRRR